jgi:hypothetical protein
MKRKLNLDAKSFIDTEDRFLETFQKLWVLNQQREEMISRDNRLDSFRLLPKFEIPEEVKNILQTEVLPAKKKNPAPAPSPAPQKPEILRSAEKRAKRGDSMKITLPESEKDLHRQ